MSRQAQASEERLSSGSQTSRLCEVPVMMAEIQRHDFYAGLLCSHAMVLTRISINKTLGKGVTGQKEKEPSQSWLMFVWRDQVERRKCSPLSLWGCGAQGISLLLCGVFYADFEKFSFLVRQYFISPPPFAAGADSDLLWCRGEGL